MASKSLFGSSRGVLTKPADTINEAGGGAYALSAENALAQLATTGCLNATFYSDDKQQLAAVLKFAAMVEPEFLAKVAVYAREKGAMKDMPALLCAILASRDGELLEKVFPRVIDSARMLRTFVQIMRSGATGRKSLGSRPKRLVRSWIAARSDEAIFAASVGNDPSLADILKMVHPKPSGPSREALLGYILGRPHDVQALPEVVRAFEAFKSSLSTQN